MRLATGRFDQKPIDDDHPKPTGPTETDALMVIGAMFSAVERDPALVSHILPNEFGVYLPIGMGTPWSEIENMTLAHEMLIIVKEAYKIKDESTASNVSPSKRIAELRRGIFAKLSGILNVKYGMDRSEAACKNQWYRELRERTHVDERLAFDCSGKKTNGSRMSVSLNVSTKHPSKSKTLSRSPSKPKSVTKKPSPVKQQKRTQTKLNFAVAKHSEHSPIKHDEMFEPALGEDGQHGFQQDPPQQYHKYHTPPYQIHDYEAQTHQVEPYHFGSSMEPTSEFLDLPDLPSQPWEYEPQFHRSSYSPVDYGDVPPSGVVESIEGRPMYETDTWASPSWEDFANVDPSQFEIDPLITTAYEMGSKES